MRKGSRQTEEAKAKISAAKMGKPSHPQGPESRAKIAAARRGQPRPPLTDEGRQRMRAAQQARQAKVRALLEQALMPRIFSD